MCKRVLARCMPNGHRVLWQPTTPNPKSRSTTRSKSVWRDKSRFATHVPPRFLTYVKTCSKWLGLKSAYSAWNARKPRSRSTWFSTKTTFRSVIFGVNAGKKKDKFIFTVESVGQLHAATIVKNSMIVLRKKLKDLQERIAWTIKWDLISFYSHLY